LEAQKQLQLQQLSSELAELQQRSSNEAQQLRQSCDAKVREVPF